MKVNYSPINTALRAGSGILNEMLEFVWPMRCVGCERLGELFCEDCLRAAPFIKQATVCPRCGAPYGALACTECQDAYGRIYLSFSHAISVFEFKDVAARLTVIYKDQHEQRLATICAALIAKTMPLPWRVWPNLLTYIPSTAGRIRERGFDHMQLMAQQLGANLKLPVYNLLRKEETYDQRTLNRDERIENLIGAFMCASPADAKGHNILLIDDVYTTGATLESAAAVLMEAGAREVRVATVCRVY